MDDTGGEIVTHASGSTKVKVEPFLTKMEEPEDDISEVPEHGDDDSDSDLTSLSSFESKTDDEDDDEDEKSKPKAESNERASNVFRRALDRHDQHTSPAFEPSEPDESIENIHSESASTDDGVSVKDEDFSVNGDSTQDGVSVYDDSSENGASTQDGVSVKDDDSSENYAATRGPDLMKGPKFSYVEYVTSIRNYATCTTCSCRKHGGRQKCPSRLWKDKEDTSKYHTQFEMRCRRTEAGRMQGYCLDEELALLNFATHSTDPKSEPQLDERKWRKTGPPGRTDESVRKHWLQNVQPKRGERSRYLLQVDVREKDRFTDACRGLLALCYKNLRDVALTWSNVLPQRPESWPGVARPMNEDLSPATVAELARIASHVLNVVVDHDELTVNELEMPISHSCYWVNESEVLTTILDLVRTRKHCIKTPDSATSEPIFNATLEVWLNEKSQLSEFLTVAFHCNTFQQDGLMAAPSYDQLRKKLDPEGKITLMIEEVGFGGSGTRPVAQVAKIRLMALFGITKRVPDSHWPEGVPNKDGWAAKVEDARKVIAHTIYHYIDKGRACDLRQAFGDYFRRKKLKHVKSEKYMKVLDLAEILQAELQERTESPTARRSMKRKRLPSYDPVPPKRQNGMGSTTVDIIVSDTVRFMLEKIKESGLKIPDSRTEEPRGWKTSRKRA